MEKIVESKTSPPIPEPEKDGGVRACPKCAQEISNTASACPHCGQPFEVSNGAATASLVLGMLSFAGCTFFTAAPAIILGHKALSNIQKSALPMGGRRSAIAGLILGYANVFLIVLVVVGGMTFQNLLRSRIQDNEAAAISHLRMLTRAQTVYSCADGPYAPDFDALTSSEKRTACLFGDWHDGVQKDGYIFTMKGVLPINGVDSLPSCYEATASPAVPGRMGVRYFFMDCSGVIRGNKDAPAKSTSPPD